MCWENIARLQQHAYSLADAVHAINYHTPISKTNFF